MKSKYQLLILICFTIFIWGCNDQNFSYFDFPDKSNIHIKTNHGSFICADRNKDNQIIANRASAGEWETFSIEFSDDNKVRLLTSDYLYIGSESEQKGLLVAKYTNDDENAFFLFTKIDSVGYVIQDYQNKYVFIDENQNLIANKVDIQEASVFTISPLPAKLSTHFTSNHLILLIFGLVLLLSSILSFHYYENKNISLLLLLLGGFCVRLFVALLNQYLNLWDEQFHALVAKNMMNNPLAPMLYKNPVLPYDETSWVGGHIWLHKQPLFLWQMAISMEIFGVNTFGLRLPSAVMATIVLYFIYRIGKLSVNNRVGYFAALFFALSNFSLELSSGTIHTDHNDAAFLFYICASIWAWVEYENKSSSGKRYYLILIGLFSGCAVLVKWTTGILVYSGWGLSILFSKERRIHWSHYRDLLLSFGITLLICLPWQIYSLLAFPDLSKYEFSLNTRHFFEVIEGHGGDFWWHFDRAKELYGVNIYYILISVIVFLISIKDIIFRIGFLTYIIIIYIFFSIAATKMIAFTYSISFLIFLAFGATIESFFKVIIINPRYLPHKIYHILYVTVILGVLSVINLDIEKIQERHTMWKKDENSDHFQRTKSIQIIKRLSEHLPDPENYVVFNCRPDDNIPIMFFNNVAASYSMTPDNNIYLSVKKKGYKIAVFDDGKLPSYLKEDTEVIKINGYWKDT